MALRIRSKSMIAVSAMGILPFVGLALSSPAHADFQLCNKTSQPVTVAVGWIDPYGNGFTSQGWWTLQAGGDCETLVLNSETSDRHNYFFYAHGRGGVWRGDTTLCTKRDAFTISGPAGGGWCTDVGFDSRDFVHVNAASENHTTNLTE